MGNDVGDSVKGCVTACGVTCVVEVDGDNVSSDECNIDEGGDVVMW